MRFRLGARACERIAGAGRTRSRCASSRVRECGTAYTQKNPPCVPRTSSTLSILSTKLTRTHTHTLTPTQNTPYTLTITAAQRHTRPVLYARRHIYSNAHVEALEPRPTKCGWRPSTPSPRGRAYDAGLAQQFVIVHLCVHERRFSANHILSEQARSCELGMKFSRLFTKLDGGAFGYALSMDGSTCLQLGTHGSLTSVSPVASCVPASYVTWRAASLGVGAAWLVPPKISWRTYL
jgi:hypothetical protein